MNGFLRALALAALLCGLLAPETAMAMPPVVAVAVAWAVGAITVGQALIMVATIAYGAYKQDQARKAAKDAYNAGLTDRTVTIVSADSPWQIIYGEAVVGGTVAAILTSGDRDQYKHMVLVWAAHECEAITDILIKGVSVGALDGDQNVTVPKWFKRNVETTSELLQFNSSGSAVLSAVPIRVLSVTQEQSVPLPGGGDSGSTYVTTNDAVDTGAITISGKTVTVAANKVANVAGKTLTINYDTYSGSASVRVHHHLGSPTQTADATLMAELPNDWKATDRLQGLCYSVIRFDLNEPEFQSGPVQVTARIKGKKVYDPRDGVTRWSANPALCTADFLCAEYGKAALPTQVIWPSVTAAANASAEQISVVVQGVASSADLYTCNGAFKTDADTNATLTALCQSMAGFAVYSGAWTLQAGVYTAPVMALTDADNAGSVDIVAAPADDEVFNGLRGRFYDPERYDQITDYTPYKNAAFVAEDGAPIWNDLAFPFSNSNWRAQNLARVFVERSRAMTLVYPAKRRARPLRAGQRVTLSNSLLGFTNVVFRVVKREARIGQPVKLTLTRDDPTFYDRLDATASLPSPSVFATDPWVVDPVANLQVQSSAAVAQFSADGTVISSTLVTYDASTDVLVTGSGALQVEYRLDSATAWTRAPEAPGSSTRMHLQGLEDKRSYLVRARWRNSVTQGPWASATVITIDASRLVGSSWATLPGIPANLAGLSGAEAIRNADIVVGGVNLLTHSTDFSTFNNGSGSTILATGQGDHLGGQSATRIAFTGNAAGERYRHITGLRVGGTYTASVWINRQSGGNFCFTATNGSSWAGSAGVASTATFGAWARLTITITTDTGVVDLCLGGHSKPGLPAQTAATVVLDSVQLEEGNAATQWGAAPQDIADIIATAQQTANDATTQIGIVSNDRILSKGEKPAELLRLQAMLTRQPLISAQALAFSITTERTDYNASLSALQFYLSSIGPFTNAWGNPAVDSDIDPDTYRTNWNTAIAAEMVLLSKISTVAATLANWNSVAGRPLDAFNAVFTPTFDSGSIGAWVGGAVVVVSGQPFKRALQATSRDLIEQQQIPVKGGETLYCYASIDASSATSRVSFGFEAHRADGSLSGNGWYPVFGVAAGGAWAYGGGAQVVPADATYVLPWVQIDGTGGVQLPPGRVTNLYIGRVQPGATVGADWATNLGNIPYASVYNNDDSVALGFSTEDWPASSAYPNGWVNWGGPAPSRETNIVRAGASAVRFSGVNNGNVGIMRQLDLSAAPLPTGTFASGSVDFFLAARSSGSPLVLVRLRSSASQSGQNNVEVLVRPPDATTGVWQRVPWAARLPAGQRIHWIEIFQMASWDTPGTTFAGDVIFDNLLFALYDNSTDNTALSLSAAGQLSTGGVPLGNVTITGLGYTGALDATANPVFRQQTDPGQVPDGARWIQTDGNGTAIAVYDRVAGNWYTGPTGPQGAQGIQGPRGTDGQTTYFHIAYASAADGSAGFNQNSGAFVGTYVDTTAADSGDYHRYTWRQFVGSQGPQGGQGIPGTTGPGGTPSYLHIKYSNDGGATFTGSGGEEVGSWIGTYVDAVANDSTAVGAYTWARLQPPNFRQEEDPGAVQDGATWTVPSTGKSYVRQTGAWVPYVGAGSVNTVELAPNAATDLQSLYVAAGGVGCNNSSVTKTEITRTYTNATSATVPVQVEVTTAGLVSWNSSYPSVARSYCEWSSASSGSGTRVVVPRHADGSSTGVHSQATVVDILSVAAGDTLTVMLKHQVTHTALAVIDTINNSLRLAAVKR